MEAINGLAQAERIFAKQLPTSRWHSEADRQEHIDTLAREIEQQINADIMRFDAEAMEIAGDLFGCMEPEAGAMVLRLLLSEDPVSHHMARQLILVEKEKTVSRTAEYRAIRAVEAGE
jgi:hypothetical protein